MNVGTELNLRFQGGTLRVVFPQGLTIEQMFAAEPRLRSCHTEEALHECIREIEQQSGQSATVEVIGRSIPSVGLTTVDGRIPTTRRAA
jgi:hypothetical protein